MLPRGHRAMPVISSADGESRGRSKQARITLMLPSEDAIGVGEELATRSDSTMAVRAGRRPSESFCQQARARAHGEPR